MASQPKSISRIAPAIGAVAVLASVPLGAGHQGGDTAKRAAVERFAEAEDGCRLWTAASGTPADRAFVLCHGGPGFWDTLAPIADVLDDLGLVVRWDQRGGGRSEHRGP